MADMFLWEISGFTVPAVLPLCIDRICTGRVAGGPEAMPNFPLPSPIIVSPLRLQFNLLRSKQNLLHPLIPSSGLNLGEAEVLSGA